MNYVFNKDRNTFVLERTISDLADEMSCIIRQSQYGGDFQNLFIISEEDFMSDLMVDKESFEKILAELINRKTIKIHGKGSYEDGSMIYSCSFTNGPSPSKWHIKDSLCLYKNATFSF